MPFKPKLESSIAKSFVFYILIFSSFIALISTSIQLFFEYKRDISVIERTAEQIEKSHKSTISQALWTYDTLILESQLKGIKTLPGVVYACIKKNKKILKKIGIESHDQKVMTYKYVLRHQVKSKDLQLGSLEFEISLSDVYEHLWDRVVLILITQTLKTFFVSIFILFLFHFIVGRHLNNMATCARSTNLKNLENNFSLNRKGGKSNKADELGLVESALNSMRVKLLDEMKTVLRTQTALKHAEEKYRRLTENAKDMIYRMSLPDGKYEYVSPAAENIFGYPPEVWYENPILIQNIIHPDFHEYFSKKWKLLLKGEVSPTYEYQIQYRDNKRRWIHQRNVGVRDKKGKLIAIEGIVTDITDLKKSEKALQDSHKRFLTVLNSIDATIYVVDIDNFEILFMNQCMIESFGKDMTGKICWDVYRGESEQCTHCPIDKIVDKDGNPKGVHIWQTKNPITQKWYLNYDRAIEWIDGRIVKLQVATDITEFKRMEDELRQAHKMESVGTISGGIAHDFNNILGIIIGNAELAIEDIPDWSPAQENMKEIKIAGMRARDIVKQLLSFSRKTEQAQKNIQVLPIIKESIKLIRSSIPTTIDIQLNAEDIEGVIKADPTQIHQILINMCTNAAHAMDENGGHLIINLSEIHLDSISKYQFQDVEPGVYIQLTIEDTGIGIDRSIVNRIFDPYFTTKEVGKGSGMGLAVVHGIVKSCNGSISVYSEPEKGTTFKFLFPSVGKESSKEKKSTNKIPTGNERILFVDDEEALAKIGANMLKLLGYDVVHETNAPRALDLIKAEPHRFDLIITDMTMPTLTGDQLSQKILEINPELPIILCTGFSHKIDSESALKMGIKQYIEKPFNKKQLATLIRKVLSN